MREGKIYPTECRIPENKKEAVLCEQYKKIEENNRIEKIRDLLRKLEIPREYFMQGWA